MQEELIAGRHTSIREFFDEIALRCTDRLKDIAMEQAKAALDIDVELKGGREGPLTIKHHGEIALVEGSSMLTM